MKIADKRTRRIWAMAIGGFPTAVAEKDHLHAQYPELDAQFEEFKAFLERGRTTKRKRKKVHTDVAKTVSVWSRAKDKHMSSTKSSAWPVNGGLPSLGKRR